jgi:hypothetical protein
MRNPVELTPSTTTVLSTFHHCPKLTDVLVKTVTPKQTTAETMESVCVSFVDTITIVTMYYFPVLDNSASLDLPFVQVHGMLDVRSTQLGICLA